MGELLDKLSKHRVFSITPAPDGAFIISEGCDDYFDETLSREELKALAREIMELADNANTGVA